MFLFSFKSTIVEPLQEHFGWLSHLQQSKLYKFLLVIPRPEESPVTNVHKILRPRCVVLIHFTL